MEIEIKEPLQKVTGKIEGWINAFIEMLPNMFVALLILILFVVAGNLVKRLVQKAMTRTHSNQSIIQLLSTITYYLVLALGLFFILDILQLKRAVVSLLAGVGVVGLALGFAFQDIAANLISGVILAVRSPIRIGDIISVQDVMGTVVRMDLRATVLETFQGQEVYIPNKEVLQTNITNFSALGQRRIDLSVGISYGDNLQEVEDLVIETIGGLEGVIRKENMIFDYTEFGSSSVNFTIRFWIEYPDQPGFLSMRNQAIKEIKKAFDTNDITIPFPIRTLDFGIKGGEKLSQMKLHTVLNKYTNGTE